jgi:hypothetical protein
VVRILVPLTASDAIVDEGWPSSKPVNGGDCSIADAALPSLILARSYL